jgi:hypothetical protein
MSHLPRGIAQDKGRHPLAAFNFSGDMKCLPLAIALPARAYPACRNIAVEAVLSTVSETRLARLTDLSALLPNSCFRSDFALLRLEACVSTILVFLAIMAILAIPGVPISVWLP